MPTIGEIFCFYVPRSERIDGTPCNVVPCPYCRGIHLLRQDAPDIVKSQCPPHDASFEDRARPDFWQLIHGGPALRELVLLLERGEDMGAKLGLLKDLQPTEIWSAVKKAVRGPTQTPDPSAAPVAAAHQAGDALDQDVKIFIGWPDKTKPKELNDDV